jgi:hypothetical protein
MKMVTMEIDKPIYDKLDALAKRGKYGDAYAYLVDMVLQKTREMDREIVMAAKQKDKKIWIPKRQYEYLEKRAADLGQNVDDYVCGLVGERLQELIIETGKI